MRPIPDGAAVSGAKSLGLRGFQILGWPLQARRYYKIWHIQINSYNQQFFEKAFLFKAVPKLQFWNSNLRFKWKSGLLAAFP
jgi:hypothetical protein